jgi:hypothetical protein
MLAKKQNEPELKITLFAFIYKVIKIKKRVAYCFYFLRI